MAKTDRQTLLEIQHGKPIRELVLEALEKHQGTRFHLTLAALELDITVVTLRTWATRLRIDLSKYSPPEDDEMEPDAVPARAGKP